ncbi:hypothetical protein LMIY3S_00020 [Labrys miyagiensis]
MDTWNADHGLTAVAAVAETIREFLPHADGLTISGGEPFDQPDALRTLLQFFRDNHAGDIFAYSGRTMEQLHPLLPSFEGLIDAVMAEPFLEDAEQTLTLRGSDNQRLICLTPLGEERFAKLSQALSQAEASLDVMFDKESGEVFLAGIPRRGDMHRLLSILARAGHSAKTTEDKRNSR